MSAVGGTLDKTTGLVKIPAGTVDKMESLFFNVSGVSPTT
jgi:hypothetical protein